MGRENKYINHQYLECKRVDHAHHADSESAGEFKSAWQCMKLLKHNENVSYKLIK